MKKTEGRKSRATVPLRGRGASSRINYRLYKMAFRMQGIRSLKNGVNLPFCNNVLYSIENICFQIQHINIMRNVQLREPVRRMMNM
jgi:hypothetical protein